MTPSEPVHVVALSGGKDSSAMALRLAELEPRAYVYVCTPTGNESAAMFAHWRRLADLLGRPLTPIVGGTLLGLVNAQRAIPNWRQRWCTRLLKIEPYAAFLGTLPGPVVSYVGLRADEPDRAGGDYAAVAGVTSRYPLREWGWRQRDVWAYLEARGVTIPERTDCQLCFFQRIGEWYRLWETDPAMWAEGERTERETGHTWRSPGRDTWPAAMVDLGREFERGNVPRDAAQGDLFADLKCRVCRL